MAAGVLAQLGIPLEEAWRYTATARGRPVPDTEEQPVVGNGVSARD